MANYFLGIKGIGVRGLNSQIKKAKFKGKTLQDTIDKLNTELKLLDIIEFDGNKDVYVGTFFYSEKEKSESLLKQSKEYKQKLKIVEEEFNNVGIDKTNMIIQKSEEMD